MSRVGRLPITLPAGVTVSLNNSVVTVKGPLGTLTQAIENKDITVNVGAAEVTITRANDKKESRSAHGLYRQLVANMVAGVVKPYEKILVISGVGYRAAVNGSKLAMHLGFSHPVEIAIPEGIKAAVKEGDDKDKKTLEVKLEGISKEKVGQFAAIIKAKRPVEPYHGYGIHYSDEVVIRKEGKTSGKK